MDIITKVKNQQLAVNRCFINIERANAELERVFSAKIHYPSIESHCEAVGIAQENVEMTHIILQNQLRTNAIANGLTGSTAPEEYARKRLAELQLNHKEAGVANGTILLLLNERMCEIKGIISVFEKSKSI